VYLLATVAFICFPGHLPPPAANYQYVFVADPERRVGIQQGLRIRIGTLDADGSFLESEVIETWERSGPVMLMRDGSVSRGGRIIRPYENVTPPGRCYQLKKGMLTPGEFDDVGNFIRVPNSANIRFQDYDPVINPLRIWNLPGRFVQKPCGKS
jgi:hypothetical protein